MPFPWDVLASSVGGATVTLLSVATGAALSTRAQRQHWARDRRINACQVILTESTRTQILLRRKWRHGDTIDFTPWNEALSSIWLVGHPDLVAIAYRMDRLFWETGARISGGEITSEETWAVARDAMEKARLDFINAARRNVLHSRDRLAEKPIARPPLPAPPEQASD